jgi:hypothetical protein
MPAQPKAVMSRLAEGRTLPYIEWHDLGRRI